MAGCQPLIPFLHYSDAQARGNVFEVGGGGEGAENEAVGVEGGKWGGGIPLHSRLGSG